MSALDDGNKYDVDHNNVFAGCNYNNNKTLPFFSKKTAYKPKTHTFNEKSNSMRYVEDSYTETDAVFVMFFSYQWP